MFVSHATHASSISSPTPFVSMVMMVQHIWLSTCTTSCQQAALAVLGMPGPNRSRFGAKPVDVSCLVNCLMSVICYNISCMFIKGVTSTQNENRLQVYDQVYFMASSVTFFRACIILMLFGMMLFGDHPCQWSTGMQRCSIGAMPRGPCMLLAPSLLNEKFPPFSISAGISCATGSNLSLQGTALIGEPQS